MKIYTPIELMEIELEDLDDYVTELMLWYNDYCRKILVILKEKREER